MNENGLPFVCYRNVRIKNKLLTNCQKYGRVKVGILQNKRERVRVYINVSVFNSFV